MTIGIPSAILAAIVSVTVAVTILVRRPRRPLYGRFAAFAFALFIWNGASVITQVSGEAIVRVQVAAGLLLAPTAILFFSELLRDHGTASQRLARGSVIVTALLLLVTVSPWGTFFAFRVVASVYVAVALALVLQMLYRHARDARGELERKRLLYLFYGGLATLVLDSAQLVPGAEVAAALGHTVATFYIYFLYQSILSRRVIDLVEFLGKAAVLAVLTLVLALVYALLVLWVGSGQRGIWLFNTLVASFVILILYDQVRPWIEEATVKLLFRRRYELGQAVRRLVRTLRTTISLDEMTDQVLDALHGSGRATQVALYLPADSELTFELKGFRGDKPTRTLGVAQQPTLLQELRRERRPILLENLVDRYLELPRSFTKGDPSLEHDLARTGEAIAAMRTIGANVLLPIVAGEGILGVLSIGTEGPAEAYSTEEIASLLSVTDACAVVIENSHEYEKLRERDRLVAVGEMATGMAHEIRNPLGAIKGAAQCLDPESLPADAAEFVAVIIEEVDRLNKVLTQFLEYARPYRGNPAPTSVNSVVSATVRLMAREVPEEVRLEEDLGAELPTVSVDPEQLKQVLINLVLNAIQAMPHGGTVRISTDLGQDDGAYLRRPGSTHVRIRVEDTGEGIGPDDLQRVFMPFFTTKPHGTGLGLAISHRIVKNSGGRLDVSSKLGAGTTFTLRLPAAHEAGLPQLDGVAEPAVQAGS